MSQNISLPVTSLIQGNDLGTAYIMNEKQNKDCFVSSVPTMMMNRKSSFILRRSLSSLKLNSDNNKFSSSSFDGSNKAYNVSQGLNQTKLPLKQQQMLLSLTQGRFGNFSTQDAHPPLRSELLQIANGLPILCDATERFSLKQYYRIIPIDEDVLLCLRHILPRLLGGYATGMDFHENSDTTTHHSSLSFQRKFVSNKKTPCVIPHHLLLRLYDLITRMCAKLSTSHWPNPQYHRKFFIDGGWPVYILHLHKLVAACLIQTHVLQTMEASHELRMSSDCIGTQSNCFETRALWAAAETVAQQHKHSTASSLSKNLSTSGAIKYQHSFIHTDSVMYFDYPCSQGTSGTDQSESPSTCAYTNFSSKKTFEGLNSFDSISALQKDTTIDEDQSESRENSKAHSAQLYILLLDNSSNFLQIESPDQDDVPCLTSTGKLTSSEEDRLIFTDTTSVSTDTSDAVSFVQASTCQKNVCICLDTHMLSFAINGSGRYDAYLWAVFLEILLSHREVLEPCWKILIPGVFCKKKTVNIHCKIIFVARTLSYALACCVLFCFCFFLFAYLIFTLYM